MSKSTLAIGALAAEISQAGHIAFLTGAGMSTESGIPDFRSSTGLYATVTSEEIFDIRAFRRDPADFYAFARTFFADMMQATPNTGHDAMAQFEHRFGKNVHIATQNIDTLHQQAGSSHVYPMHGTTETCTCMKCGVRVETNAIWPEIEAGKIPRHIDCGGIFKPDIVFYGEMLPEETVLNAQCAMRNADIVIAAGTSLGVYPAAGLPECRRPGTPYAIINLTPTPQDHRADIIIREPIGETLRAVMDLID